MDQLLPRKPQDVDRWTDDDTPGDAADPTTGPGDRWVNEAARGDPDYPAADAGEGGVSDINTALEDDGDIGERPADPLIKGQAQ
jgi:hypothetical protein